MALDIFVKLQPKHVDGVTGDAVWYLERGAMLWALVVDGLGSGEHAAAAAQLAVASIGQQVEALADEIFDPADTLRHMLMTTDQALRRSRGAAVGLALLDATRCEGHYAGVGNIGMRLIDTHAQARPLCTPGIVGGGIKRLRVERFAYRPGQLIIMHSDGISSRFELTFPDALLASLEALGEDLAARHGQEDDLTLLMVKQHA